MIQRKQTIFLFLSFILLAICLCMPIGLLEPSGMGISSKMTNLWIVDGNGAKGVALVRYPVDNTSAAFICYI